MTRLGTSRKKIIEIKPKTSVSISIKKRSEVHKHQENVATLLKYSNATPIKSKGRYYVCCFCAKDFTEPSELKKHSITHDDATKSSFMKDHNLSTFIVKLDVTDLICNICNAPCNSMEELAVHLVDKHGKLYHKLTNNHVVPFRFDTETLKCAVCRNEFNNFKVLLEHMNKHYMNYVCKVCNAGFVNKRILRTHGYRHVKGEFKCSHCAKTYDNRVKMKQHERAVHVWQNKRSKCGYCGEMFTDYTKKNEHEVRIHGAKAVVLTCHACDKKFDNQRSLTVHIKMYHLLNRRVKTPNKI